MIIAQQIMRNNGTEEICFVTIPVAPDNKATVSNGTRPNTRANTPHDLLCHLHNVHGSDGTWGMGQFMNYGWHQQVVLQLTMIPDSQKMHLDKKT